MTQKLKEALTLIAKRARFDVSTGAYKAHETQKDVVEAAKWIEEQVEKSR